MKATCQMFPGSSSSKRRGQSSAHLEVEWFFSRRSQGIFKPLPPITVSLHFPTVPPLLFLEDQKKLTCSFKCLQKTAVGTGSSLREAARQTSLLMPFLPAMSTSRRECPGVSEFQRHSTWLMEWAGECHGPGTTVWYLLYFPHC